MMLFWWSHRYILSTSPVSIQTSFMFSVPLICPSQVFWRRAKLLLLHFTHSVSIHSDVSDDLSHRLTLQCISDYTWGGDAPADSMELFLTPDLPWLWPLVEVGIHLISYTIFDSGYLFIYILIQWHFLTGKDKVECLWKWFSLWPATMEGICSFY